MIGILCWVVELGRIEIAYETYVLSWYLVQPQTGHFVQVFHIFKYLGIHKDTYLGIKPTIYELLEPLTINRKIKQTNNMYPDTVKDFPQNYLPPIGYPIYVSYFVDSNHAGGKTTRSSKSDIIL